MAVGFLQGLAKLRLLRLFDYLSTVSGGGYAGAWFAAWVRREGSLVNVEKQLDPSRQCQGSVERLIPESSGESERALAAWTSAELTGKPKVLDQEPEPVNHLRAHSRYLTPEAGLFSADTWTLLASYLRNTVINLCIITVMTMLLLFAARWLVWGFAQPGDPAGGWWTENRVSLWAGALGLCGLLTVSFMVSYRTRAAFAASDPGLYPEGSESSRWRFIRRIVVMALITAVLACWCFGVGGGGGGGGGGGPRRVVPEGLNPTTPDTDAGPLLGWLRALLHFTDHSEALAPWLRTVVKYTTLFFLGSAVLAAFAFGGRMILIRRKFLADAKKQLDDAQKKLTQVQAGAGPAAAAKKRLEEATERVAEATKRLANVNRWHRVNSCLTFSGLIHMTAIGGFLALALVLVVRPLAGDPVSTTAPDAGATPVGLGADAVSQATPPQPPLGPAAVVTLGPPAVLLAFILGGVVECMFFGRWLWDYELEWRGKLIGYLFMAAFAWLAFFGTALYLPHAVAWLATHTTDGVKPAAIIGWLLTTAGGLIAGKRTPTSGTWDRIFTVFRIVGPVVFIVGFVAVVSYLVSQFFGEHAFVSGPAFLSSPDDLRWMFGWTAASLAVLLLLNVTAGANNYSFHCLYGNRLTRCYLGASRPKACAAGPPAPAFPGGAETGVAGMFRRHNPVTGFDPNDDLPLADLRGKGPNGKRGYQGPYPLFNTALQLIAGEQLAWQDRKAASFVFTPNHCGCEGTGWAEIPDDCGTSFTVGRAMTTSGAAVDPNMANYQSAPLTVFLTVFNARTGIWLRNPARCKDRKIRDATEWWFGLPLALCYELLGQTDEKNSHVHLSDGGSFENLGVYELIRRRCRFIVACDFAEDLSDASENLANLVRRVSVDFGIRIDINTSPLHKGGDGLSPRHVSVGRIHYEEVDEEGVAGTLVFIRSSLTGDESPAIRQYANTHPDFPHQSTSNQFFDADQFEAYRALGEHMAGAVFAPVARKMEWDKIATESDEQYARRVRRLFSELRREWEPQPDDLRARYADDDRAFDRLLAGMREEPRLAGLVRSFYPELPDAPTPGGTAFSPDTRLKPLLDGLADTDVTRALMVNQVINAMETVWVTLELDRYWAHSFYRGWVNEFRRWSAAQDFRDFWPILRGEYSPGFVRFCEHQLNAPTVTVTSVRYNATDPKVNADHRRWAKELNDEFLLEWSESKDRWPKVEQTFLSIWEAVTGEKDDAMHRARPANAGPAIRDGRPLCWFATLPLNLSQSQPQYAVGVLVVYERPDKKHELLIWFRGAYRTLSLGGQFVEGIFETVLKQMPKGSTTLVARYAKAADDAPGRLQESNWKSFFYDYEFRSRKPRKDPDDTSEDRHFIVLERHLGS